MYKEQLLGRLVTRTATIGIVGLGYVGLPLAVAFAEEGFQVIGLDLNPEKVTTLNGAVSYIPDIPTEQIAPLVRSGKLRATTSYGDLSAVDCVSICVPTPLTKTKDPDMSYVISAADSITEVAHAGMLIVLESTTYPGTTDEILIPRLQAKGLTIGDQAFVAFSPERIDPANKKFGVRNTPKVIGGATEACREVTAAYYGQVIDKIVPVSSTSTAEMVKLLENTFRAVNIGLVNELALMCDRLNIDVWEVIRAASTKPFGFMPFYPGPGIGGHCIPLDPLYLSWKLKTLNYTARFIQLASEVNTSMPLHVVELVTEALNDASKAVRGAKIVVLGVAYKKDVDDVRESPALDIIQLLEERGASVSYHDPYIPSLKMDGGHRMQGVALTEALLQGCDCAVVVTDHTCFDWSWISRNAPLIIDTRNALANIQRTDGSRIVRL